MGLSRENVSDLLQQLRGAMRHRACWTCDCFQGFLRQLEMDADEDVSDLMDPLKVSADEVHGCLGCDPCPPGEVYTEYLRKCARCGNNQEHR
ncbi:MAG: hypothetical protein ACLFVW_02290 [Phycisphaerae bacterium]